MICELIKQSMRADIAERALAWLDARLAKKD
jgi:hypothetical protein